MSQLQSNRILRLGLLGGCGCALLVIAAMIVVGFLVFMADGDSEPTTRPEAQEAVTETPAVLIDGAAFEGDPSEPSSVQAAVEAA